MSVGMKTYARELLARLPVVAPEFEFVRVGSGTNFSWAEQVRLPGEIRRSGAALTHYLAHYLPYLAPQPFVLTVHDLIHLRFPQFYKSKVGPYYRTVVRRACARAARVITDDPATIEELQRFLGVDPAKVRAIPLGVSPVFSDGVVPLQTPRPYVMYVGNHRRHKDLPTLFAAWAMLPDRLAVDLYLTGPDDFGGQLQRLSSDARRIVALGDVSQHELAQRYAGARALVHPSMREGFGLPLLEAMAAGCPVIASAASLPTVLRADALSFPTGDASALRARIEDLLTDEGLRARLVKSGRASAARLTWDRCARATADVYVEVLQQRA